MSQTLRRKTSALSPSLSVFTVISVALNEDRCDAKRLASGIDSVVPQFLLTPLVVLIDIQFEVVRTLVAARNDYSETSIKRTPIKRTPSIKRTLSWVPKRTSDISLYNEPLFSGHLY